ncbi:hypothetical protein KAU33_06305 [Candidatus Dependentiae bacterium]|nr:hypothetical protein [Candidatus Dependentiae bacterium]
MEKTIVDKYVKKIVLYDELLIAIENDIHNSLRGYVICSWYNHWTSIIIEDILKDHERVLPAVGLIKKIDFFIDNIPFDLKVTYLPEGYVKYKRKDSRLKPESTLLKKVSRLNDIPIDNSLGSRLTETLWAMVKDNPAENCQQLIQELDDFRNGLLEEISENPESLIRWLYENQGARRFDSSNRLFLILVKKSNNFESWKLKRAKQLLVDKIYEYLDKFSKDNIHNVNFEWNGEQYTAVSDVILISQD